MRPISLPAPFRRCYTTLLVMLVLVPSNVFAQRQTSTIDLGNGFVTPQRIAITSDDKTIAVHINGNINTDERQNHIRLIDLKTRKEIGRMRTARGGFGHLFALTPDNAHLLCSTDYFVQIWNVKTRKLVKELAIKDTPCECAGMSANGKTLVIAYDTIELYTVPDGKHCGRLKPPSRVYLLALSRDGRWLATSHLKGKIAIWDLDKKKTVGGIEIANSATGYHEVAFSPDGKKLLVQTDSGKFALYDRATRKREKFLEVDRKIRYSVVGVTGIGPIFAPDGKTAVLAGKGSGVGIFLWDIAAGTLRGDTNYRSGMSHSCAALAKDGKTLVTGSQRFVKVWDISPPKKTK